MRSRGPSATIRTISTYFLLFSLILTVFELARFKSSRQLFPAGTMIAGVQVGGMNDDQVSELLQSVYNQPVELHYQQEIILLDPLSIGFTLNIQAMLGNAHAYYQKPSQLEAFRNYLWNISLAVGDFPLQASLAETLLDEYLHDQVAMRYDRPAQSALPQPGTVYFASGKPGYALDIEQASGLIKQALQSPTHRVVILPLRTILTGRTSFQNLEIFLKQTLARSDFDGLTALYLSDLKTGQTLYFAQQLGKDISVKPELAFSATNLVHIPIMCGGFC